MKTLVMILAAFVVSTALAVALPIKSGSLLARSDGNNVTIQWGTTDESAVKEFGIERRPATGTEYVLVATMVAKGNNSYYEYIDQTAFKTTGSVYQYRIRIVDSNSGISYSEPISVSHNVSSVKRTWGSLKAMFR